MARNDENCRQIRLFRLKRIHMPLNLAASGVGEYPNAAGESCGYASRLGSVK
jgi:hypothetical protein